MMQSLIGRKPAEIRVLDANVAGHLKMTITFSTGERRAFDASSLIGHPVFRGLAQNEVFQDFAIDRGVLCWENGAVGIVPEKLYDPSTECGRN